MQGTGGEIPTPLSLVEVYTLCPFMSTQGLVLLCVERARLHWASPGVHVLCA